MSRGPSENSSVDLLAYERPSPAKALAILEGYGMDACLGRWPFLTANAISKIVEAGRAERNAKSGIIVRTRRRTTTPEQEEAAIADVFALGAVSRAAEKHGVPYTAVLKFLRERGITDYPRVSGVEKMRLARQTKRARQALATAGISATPTPQEQEQEQDMAAAAPVTESVTSRCGGARRVPGDETIRADWKRVGHVADLASEYGVTPTGLRLHLLRLGLVEAGVRWKRGKPDVAAATVPEEPAANVVALPVPAVAAAAPSPVPGRPRTLQGIDRLDVEDLVRAVELARMADLSPDVAVAFIRADRDASVVMRSGRAA
ncbi:MULTISPECIES: hypothetical protein [Methylobacterium]|uniref:hypothetical protein n=1 Tax=Methylobacterium TaxID=407 RepID=UPI0004166D8C|nr:hypothetical protein [Methylobacterium brachiatum]SFI10996.1 hypothetical protein SAMN02799642_00838 [Methylobacterium brachiatum]